MMKSLRLIGAACGCLCTLVSITVNAATIALSDFSSDLDGWTVVGDGIVTHVSTGGNPGGFLQSTDTASGSNTDAFAPVEFLGNWSAYENVGSVSADLAIIADNNNNHTEGVEFFISGSGSSASFRFSTSEGPSTGTWTTYTLPISESDWDVSGDWDTLLSNVEVFRIDLEFIHGTEVTGLDNVRLTTVPIPAAAWFFGSGLLGLIAIARRKAS